MHRKAINHLKRTDPILAEVIAEVGACRLVPRSEGSHVDAIMRAIIYQQLSGRAAATIHGRFLALYGDRAPLPAELLATPDERLRAVGLSGQKTRYLKDLAAKVESGAIIPEGLDQLGDDEIIAALVQVKGVGRWTAHMFLIFRLGRLNVLPELDLGIRKGVQRAYRMRKLPTPEQVLKRGTAWAPYASIASWYLWRLLDQPSKAPAASRSRGAVRARKRKLSISTKTEKARAK